MKKLKTNLDRPHVALLVETSLASGRDIVQGVARYLREQGPWSIYHEPRSLTDSVPAWLKRWRGDGIIARLQTKKIAEAVAAIGVPAVDVLGVARHAKIPLVHVDNAAIARAAAEHLLERGFKHFGFCGIAGTNWSDARREAFAQHAAAAGFQTSIFTLPGQERGNVSWEGQQDQIAAWIGELPKPVGIMACNDPRGQKVLEACRRIRVAVPDQVAVIGVDNDLPLCEISDPPLTSVCPDPTRVGFTAAGLLHRMMRGERPPTKPIYLQPIGIATRHSTDVLAMEDREIADILRLIREQACEGMNVEDLMQRTLLPRNSLARRFRNALGRSIHDEIVRVRIARAKDLLATTELPIGLVAERSGFRHQEYLGVVFKARVGMTPAQYRRDARSARRVD
jgi:LacI family transcriptional regulator